MNKICTSIEQSKKLIELGIDINTADMFWDLLDGDEPDEKIPNCCWDRFDITINEFVPAWSLSALLDLMPKIHGERPILDTGRIQTEKYYVEYPYHESTKNDWYSTKLCDSAVDAAFEMVCWVINNGHFVSR